MEPVELLDVLGNENRRRILQLLSFRPFYFNEMAKRLNVGPKAVIDHLDMLERAGLIECYTESRRKYFRISRHMVLEVALSPHNYGIRAYGPPQEMIAEAAPSPDLASLKKELQFLEEERTGLQNRLSELQSMEAELKRQAVTVIRGCSRDSVEREVLLALFSGPLSETVLARSLEIPKVIIVDVLRKLEVRGAVRLGDRGWTLGDGIQANAAQNR